MNKKNYKILFFMLFVIIGIYTFLQYKNNTILAKDIYSIKQKIIASPVIATINNDCNIYLDKELKNIITTIKKGTNVKRFIV